MEALIADIATDMRLLRKEMESIERKISRLKDEQDPENVDSHNKAIAATLHSLYSGYETIIERVIRAVDGDVPLGKQYHIMLLKRAMNAIEDVRPAIISIETFKLLDELRTYRHKFRNIYLYLLSSERIIELARKGIASYKSFAEDVKTFQDFLLSKPT